MLNVVFQNNKLILDDIEYDVLNYELVFPGVHIFLISNQYNPIIYLEPSDTTINGVQMDSNDSIVQALGNPPVFPEA
jgi:hypothetical protein